MQILTTKEAAGELGTSVRMVQYYTKTGRLKLYKQVGKGYVYTATEVARFKRNLK